MEPRILLIGRNQSTLDVLIDELKRYGRDVAGTTHHETLVQWVDEKRLDFVVIGGGLDDTARAEVVALIQSASPGLPVHLLPRTPGSSPASVIPFVNEHAVLFKVHAAAAGPPSNDGNSGSRSQHL